MNKVLDMMQKLKKNMINVHLKDDQDMLTTEKYTKNTTRISLAYTSYKISTRFSEYLKARPDLNLKILGNIANNSH